ncbi:unnamed protein product [Withania somnifera]
MDFNLKQRRNEEKNESEEKNSSAKLPRLVLDLDSSFSSCYSQSVSGFSDTESSALPLFVSEPTNKLAAFTLSSDSTLTATKFPRMGSSYFSLAQWQELELQALVYKHMLAGAPIPHELLHLIKKSLISSSPYYNLPHQQHQQYHHYQQTLLQSGYWGRTNMDPEPGRCRRTDGKKWRCSRDVVSGHKYCERHVHRGKNRSRKPVENTTTTTAPRGILKANPSMANHGGVTPQFSLSGHAASIDLLHLNQRPLESIVEKRSSMEAQNDGKSNGQILLHFFDDWPRQQLQEQNENASSMASATSLSISMPGNPSSDVSLKLSTGDRHNSGTRLSNVERSTWGTNHVASMGGPLAEALRSSMSNERFASLATWQYVGG